MQAYNKLKPGQLSVKSLIPTDALDYVPTIVLPDTGVSEAVSGASEAVGEFRKNFWSSYNSGVTWAIGGVVELPGRVRGLGGEATDWLIQQTKTE